MDGMEEKIGSILGNPEMMSQIMKMAQALGQSQQENPPSVPKQPPKQEQAPPKGMPGPSDLAMIQKIASVTQQTGIDKNQQNLLRALHPYLGSDRISKLEKAMRAAKIAGFAAAALGGGGILSNGR